jgi:hypothetical protein
VIDHGSLELVTGHLSALLLRWVLRILRDVSERFQNED